MDTVETNTQEMQGRMPSPIDGCLMNLHTLMDKLEGDDKCVVCNAIKQLEECSKSSNDNWYWPMLIMALGFGWGSNGNPINWDAIAKAYLDTSTKTKEEEKPEE